MQGIHLFNWDIVDSFIDLSVFYHSLNTFALYNGDIAEIIQCINHIKRGVLVMKKKKKSRQVEHTLSAFFCKDAD
ncbi:MAG: hypothetical protein K0R80_182 [Clostridia bacterium]|nr:hypothetical protein [Clostridia bacterium]